MRPGWPPLKRGSTQMMLLALLDEEGQIERTEFRAAHHQLKPVTVRNAISALADRGLITRTRKTIGIAPAGRETLQKMREWEYDEETEKRRRQATSGT